MNNSAGGGAGSSGFGSMSASSHMERRLEEEVARQQQSAMLANEMAMAARMNQQMMGGAGTVNTNNAPTGGNHSGGNYNFGNGNMGEQSRFVTGGTSSQRQQGLYDNNTDFFNVSDRLVKDTGHVAPLVSSFSYIHFSPFCPFTECQRPGIYARYPKHAKLPVVDHASRCTASLDWYGWNVEHVGLFTFEQQSILEPTRVCWWRQCWVICYEP